MSGAAMAQLGGQVPTTTVVMPRTVPNLARLVQVSSLSSALPSSVGALPTTPVSPLAPVLKGASLGDGQRHQDRLRSVVMQGGSVYSTQCPPKVEVLSPVELQQRSPVYMMTAPGSAAEPVAERAVPVTTVPMGPQALDSLFNALDRNHDGFITRNEWNRAMMQTEPMAHEQRGIPVTVTSMSVPAQVSATTTVVAPPIYYRQAAQATSVVAEPIMQAEAQEMAGDDTASFQQALEELEMRLSTFQVQFQRVEELHVAVSQLCEEVSRQQAVQGELQEQLVLFGQQQAQVNTFMPQWDDFRTEISYKLSELYTGGPHAALAQQHQELGGELHGVRRELRELQAQQPWVVHQEAVRKDIEELCGHVQRQGEQHSEHAAQLRSMQHVEANHLRSMQHLEEKVAMLMGMPESVRAELTELRDHVARRVATRTPEGLAQVADLRGSLVRVAEQQVAQHEAHAGVQATLEELCAVSNNLQAKLEALRGEVLQQRAHFEVVVRMQEEHKGQGVELAGLRATEATQQLQLGGLRKEVVALSAELRERLQAQEKARLVAEEQLRASVLRTVQAELNQERLLASLMEALEGKLAQEAEALRPQLRELHEGAAQTQARHRELEAALSAGSIEVAALRRSHGAGLDELRGLSLDLQGHKDTYVRDRSLHAASSVSLERHEDLARALQELRELVYGEVGQREELRGLVYGEARQREELREVILGESRQREELRNLVLGEVRQRETLASQVLALSNSDELTARIEAETEQRCIHDAELHQRVAREVAQVARQVELLGEELVRGLREEGRSREVALSSVMEARSREVRTAEQATATSGFNEELERLAALIAQERSERQVSLVSSKLEVQTALEAERDHCATQVRAVRAELSKIIDAEREARLQRTGELASTVARDREELLRMSSAQRQDLDRLMAVWHSRMEALGVENLAFVPTAKAFLPGSAGKLEVRTAFVPPTAEEEVVRVEEQHVRTSYVTTTVEQGAKGEEAAFSFGNPEQSSGLFGRLFGRAAHSQPASPQAAGAAS